MITPLISTCAKISYSTWTAQKGNTNKILGRILQVFRYVMKSSSFDCYGTFKNVTLFENPQGEKGFFFFSSKSAKLEKFTNSSQLPVSFLFFN